MGTVAWMVLGFLLGAVPFSVIIGKTLLGVDIRDYGDGNPGAVNVWRAGGWKVGMLAVVADFSKGLIPVLLALKWGGVDGWWVIPAILAPPLGHAFSPFLNFKGGKAIAATFGSWTGAFFPLGFLGLGVSMGIPYIFLKSDAWTVVLGCGLFTLLLLVLRVGAPITVAWILNATLVIWKHRREIREPIRLRFGAREG